MPINFARCNGGYSNKYQAHAHVHLRHVKSDVQLFALTSHVLLSPLFALFCDVRWRTFSQAVSPISCLSIVQPSSKDAAQETGHWLRRQQEGGGQEEGENH